MHVTSILGSGGLRLRGFGPEDVQGRRACGRDPEIMRMFGGSPTFTAPVPMTTEEAVAWYDQVTDGPDPHHWAIELDGRFVGTARLHSVDETDRRARYALGILDRGVWGRGVGRQVTRMVLDFGFEQLGLHRIDLRVLAFNERALRCYRSCGFTEEGRERESAFVDGAWHDDVIMGILAHELEISS